MKTVRERMDIISAFREVGSYHGAAEICATTAKTVKRVVEAAQRSEPRPAPTHNYDEVADLVAQRVAKTKGRISAKRRSEHGDRGLFEARQRGLTEGGDEALSPHYWDDVHVGHVQI